MNKIALIISIIILITGCTNTDNNALSSSLTPARELEGEWKTTFPVTFYIKTDFNSMDLEDVGSEERIMTWVITSTNEPNIVNVEVSWTTQNRTLSQGSGYTPDVPLMSLTGEVSSTELRLKNSDEREIGIFSFTTDLMMGTWNDSWSMAYSQEVYTKTNELKLTRQ